MKNFKKYLVPGINISYQPKIKPSLRSKINSPEAAYKLFLETWNLDKIYLCEEMKIMLLDSAQGVIAIQTISVGGTKFTVVDPKIIMLYAIGSLANRIIIAHNHPSGSLKPSENDLARTLQIQKIAKALDIGFDDHLIITTDGFTSIISQLTACSRNPFE